MSAITISVISKPAPFKKDLAVVLGVKAGTKSTTKDVQLAKGAFDSGSLASHNLEQLGATATLEGFTKTNAPSGSIFGLIGIGDKSLSEAQLRGIGGVAARNLSNVAEIIFDLPKLTKPGLIALIEGALLGAYEFNTYRSKKSSAKLTKVSVVSEHKLSANELKRIKQVVDSVNATRDLVNTPPNALYPASMVKAIQSAIKGTGVSIRVWDEKALVKDGFGGISAVGAGSSRPPRLVKLEYKPKGAKKHLAIVGKGITFDSGGLSLKPAESMVGMKYDMTGAATSFNALLAIAKLGLPIHATAWLCLAENLPSGTATRPNDVIKIRNGKTVEVLNTDAEGRLVLADGLSAAAETKPDLIIDIATLTGAATVALGNRYAGLMGDDNAIEMVKKAVADAGELAWPMPMPAELRPLLNSDIADIANVKIGNRAGGMLVGAHFLREFVPNEIPWAHLDIAGPANNDGAAYGHTPKGATGAYVRTVINLAESLAK